MQGVKVTEKLKKKFLEELEKCGGIITTACKRTGISPKTFYRLCTDGYDLYDKEFAMEAEVIRESTAGTYAESALAFYLKRRNLKATMFYLASRNNKFTPKTKVEMNNQIVQNAEVSPAAQAAAKAYAESIKNQCSGGADKSQPAGVDNRKQNQKRKGRSNRV